MQIKDYKQFGEKANQVLMVRLTKNQKDRLQNLAEGSGFKSLSDYVRIQLLNPSTEQKINEILLLLQEKNKSVRRQND